MSKDAKIERDLLKINGNMSPPSGRILKTFLWWEASLCCRPYKLTSVKFRDFFLNLNLASFLNCKALFLPVLMDIRQLVTPVFEFALSQLSRSLEQATNRSISKLERQKLWNCLLEVNICFPSCIQMLPLFISEQPS